MDLIFDKRKRREVVTINTNSSDNEDVTLGLEGWQFNFREFNGCNNVFTNDSIEHLRQSSIDFVKKSQRGIDANWFGELLMTSKTVLSKDVQRIMFHSGFNFGYLLTCQSLPDMRQFEFDEPYVPEAPQIRLQEELQQDQVEAAVEVLSSIPFIDSSSILSLNPATVRNVSGSVESTSPANVQPQSEVFVNDIIPSSLPHIVQVGVEETDSLVTSSPTPIALEHIEEVPISKESIFVPFVHIEIARNQSLLESTSQVEAADDSHNTSISEIPVVPKPSTAMAADFLEEQPEEMMDGSEEKREMDTSITPCTSSAADSPVVPQTPDDASFKLVPSSVLLKEQKETTKIMLHRISHNLTIGNIT
ncbi:hypothetical protein MRB53_014197 [Persea americana]|uniref:Uncharacterized protein n=1 Tax=Persea americana TaxID=3435 RepID=A0ACC2KAA8_PERAE|nr:hypothetical protein MRB53_014197 [Persea americana]